MNDKKFAKVKTANSCTRWLPFHESIAYHLATKGYAHKVIATVVGRSDKGVGQLLNRIRSGKRKIPAPLKLVERQNAEYGADHNQTYDYATIGASHLRQAKSPNVDDFVDLTEAPAANVVQLAVEPRTPEPNLSKYHRLVYGTPVDRNDATKGVYVDVYDILDSWRVTNPALQHLVKKALQAGNRGHKDLDTDLQDIVDSALRAQRLGG